MTAGALADIQAKFLLNSSYRTICHEVELGVAGSNVMIRHWSRLADDKYKNL
jgi:hypothetical protein